MSTLTDYVDRAVDLAIYTGTDGRTATAQLIPDHTGGFAIAGALKVAHRYIETLLLERGSCRYRPDDGTDFMVAARHGIWRSAADVSASFYAAQLAISRQMAAAELDSDPDDEKFASATLLRIQFTGDQLTLAVQVVTQAGDSRVAIIPISIVPVVRNVA